MKSLKQKLLITFLLGSAGLYAQQGIGTNTPNENAALEIESPDKGVLIPRISLTNSSTLFLGVTSNVSHIGMLVYNTNTAAGTGLQGEGIYQWRLPSSGGATYYWFKMLTAEDSIVSGTVTHSTMRWTGSNWVQNDQLQASTTQVTMTTSLHVDSGSSTLSLTNNGLDLNTAGTLTVSATSVTVTGTAITFDGPSTFTTTVTLKGQVVDSHNSAGGDGQVLTATATGTKWANPNSSSLETLTAASVTPTLTTSIILLEPSTDMTVNIPAAASYPVGFNLKIRRNQEYSTTNSNTVTLDPAGAETINGHATRDMNVGWQSLTLINTGSAWISID